MGRTTVPLFLRHTCVDNNAEQTAALRRTCKVHLVLLPRRGHGTSACCWASTSSCCRARSHRDSSSSQAAQVTHLCSQQPAGTKSGVSSGGANHAISPLERKETPAAAAWSIMLHPGPAAGEGASSQCSSRRAEGTRLRRAAMSLMLGSGHNSRHGGSQRRCRADAAGWFPDLSLV